MVKAACKDTHRFLVSGTCPWCQMPIIQGRVRSDRCAARPLPTHWNTDALMDALDDQNEHLGLSAVSVFLCHDAKASDALLVFEKALSHHSERVRFLTICALTRLGHGLSYEESQRFEEEIENNPRRIALRVLLLGHYGVKACLFESARQARDKHIMWIIENAAECPFVAGIDIHVDASEEPNIFDHAKELWLNRLGTEMDNTAVLANAAKFFESHDPHLSEALLKKGQTLERENPKWLRCLGELHQSELKGLSGEARRAAAAQSLVEFEGAAALEPNEYRRFYMLPALSRVAFEAGEFEKAEAYARQLLESLADAKCSYAPDGDAVHCANLVLGRLALRSGETEEAKSHLIEATKAPRSPVLTSFGPNMMLAKELLETGEREVVVRYLTLCANFWQTAEHTAEQWIYQIEHGEHPDFGPNLEY